MSLQPDDHMIARYSIYRRLLEFDGTAEQIIMQSAQHAESFHPGQTVDFERVNRTSP